MRDTRPHEERLREALQAANGELRAKTEVARKKYSGRDLLARAHTENVDAAWRGHLFEHVWKAGDFIRRREVSFTAKSGPEMVATMLASVDAFMRGDIGGPVDK